MKPDTVLRAARLIRTGEVFELGRVLSETMPLPAGRRFEVLTKRTRNDPGRNRRASNEELVVSEIGQVGTQFDTFSHQMIGTSMYNCVTLDAAASRTGFTQAGRRAGRRADDPRRAPRHRGAQGVGHAGRDVRDHAEGSAGRAGGAEAHAAARRRRAHSHGLGHVVGQDNARYQRVSPGIGTAAAEWLARQDPMLVGADNSAVEISPNPDPDLAGPVHQIMLVVNGIHLLENLRLDELAARRAYEFALIVEPLKIQGGTGSTVAPIAVR